MGMGMHLSPRFTPAAHEFRPRYVHPPIEVVCKWCDRPEGEHVPRDFHNLAAILAPAGWLLKRDGPAGVWRPLPGGRAQFVVDRAPGVVEAWGSGLRWVGPLSEVVTYLRSKGCA